MRFAIISADFNPEITDGLKEGALEYFKAKGLPSEHLESFVAPGAFELPFYAKKIAQTKRFSGIVCLGAVIKGETAHFEYISEACAHGLVQVGLETGLPVTFGVLTCYNRDQALKRSSGAENKGREAARACFEAAHFLND